MSSQATKIAGGLVALALRPFLGDVSGDLVRMITRGPADQTQRLMQVMTESQDRGWRTLEIGLRGSSWWGRAANRLMGRGQEVALQGQIEAFLRDMESRGDGSNPIDSDFRERCLGELKHARTGGLVPGPSIPVDRFPEEIRIFPAGANTTQIRQAETQALGQIYRALLASGHANLARYIELAPMGDAPLLIVAVQYFFRRAIEADQGLAHLLQVQQLEQIDSQIGQALEGLDRGFRSLGDQINSVFDELSAQVSEVKSSVDGVHNKLDFIKGKMELDEARRQDAADKNQQVLMSMIIQLSEQVARLSGNAVPTATPVRIEDTRAVDDLRRQAGAALAQRQASENPEERKQAIALAEVTQRFDAAMHRAFPHLMAPTAAERSGIRPAISSGASSLFNRSASPPPRKRPPADGPARFSVSVYRGSSPCAGIRFSLVPETGGQATVLTSNNRGLIDGPEVPAGSYRLSVFDQPQKVLTVRLRPGTNVLPDWDLVARS